MRDQARVVIIGAGVAGASIAYHLAEAGCDDVLVIERAEPTSGSTFHSAGLVGQLRSSLPLTRMMMHSVDVYRRLFDAEGSTLAALPDGLSGHRLAGVAADRAAVRRLLAEQGVNPLVVSAFRERRSDQATAA